MKEIISNEIQRINNVENRGENTEIENIVTNQPVRNCSHRKKKIEEIMTKTQSEMTGVGRGAGTKSQESQRG